MAISLSLIANDNDKPTLAQPINIPSQSSRDDWTPIHVATVAPPRPDNPPPQPQPPARESNLPPPAPTANTPVPIQNTATTHNDNNWTDMNNVLLTKGNIQYHSDCQRSRVKATCTLCLRTHVTNWDWSPHDELRQLGWRKGKDASNNSTWQNARCPLWWRCIP